MKRYIFAPDMHVGYENKAGILTPTHCERSIKCMLKYAKDFKPDIMMLGGDNLDCGAVSHWLKDRNRASRGLDLGVDAKVFTSLVLEPLSKISSITDKYFMIGNHEAWIEDAIELNPGLESILAIDRLLPLGGWKIIEQGGHVSLGKHLKFIHGDTLGGGQNIANSAAQKYKNSIRFGHFHSFQVATRYNPLDCNDVNTAIMVPSLCTKNPNYLMGKPNQWLNGFLSGYLNDDGTFHDAVHIIVNGSTTIGGKSYKG